VATAAVEGAPAKFSLGRHVALAAFWFGGNFHWGVILAVLLPYQVSHLVPRSEQGTDLGIVLGLGSFFAMVLPPLVGFWSDGLSTRWGRRRPIMVVGTVINAAGLLLLMVAPSFTFLILAYLVVQIFNNAAGAAFNGIVPDVCPPDEFGKQSGVLGAMVQLGYVSGLASFLAFSALGMPLLTYGAIAVVLLVTLVPTVIASSGEGMTPVVRQPSRPPLEAAREFLKPLTSGDFAWVIFTRLMITAGIWTLFPFLQYFFHDVAGVAKAADFTSLWLLVVLLAATPFGLVGGWISDRYGRKIFVYGSGACMSLVVLVFIVVFPSQLPLLFILGIVFGLGYGLYYAVDWALACDTLPDRERPAKDMGLFHVAFTLPQVFLPAVFGLVLDIFNRQSPNSGYRVVFTGAIVFYLLGTYLVSRIKSVR
jgi:MFS family permease